MNQALTTANKGLTHYEVRLILPEDNVPIVCEDGEYRVRAGYAVWNTTTDVCEHTTTLLPGAIFQAQHLDATLTGLLNPSADYSDALVDMPVEDVIAN